MMLTLREWYLKQIKSGLPMSVSLNNGRKFIILSVSGSDDDPICKTKHTHESPEYAIEQQLNEFWSQITRMSPKHYE